MVNWPPCTTRQIEEHHLSATPFTALNLQPALLANLRSLNYQHATPIQSQSLPAILAGKDVIAQAQTGSGKTAAFGLGLLQKLDTKRFYVQSLVLCPTRELADQVANEIRKLGRGIHNIKVLTLCGGSPFGPQINSLDHGCHIVVGTPGRIEDHVNRGHLKLDKLSTLVLDEADRMLDMGFQESLEAIIEQTPDQRQTLLFSATFPEKIAFISSNIMVEPIRVEVASSHDDNSIEQHFYPIKDHDRIDVLRLLLLSHRPDSTVIFCNTRRECQEVAAALKADHFSALALHGELDQKDRDQTLIQFANNSVSILVATDVAARGLDIDNLSMVINFHIPRDLEIHTHRIGRTGRAGSKGLACTLFSDKERHKLARLEEYLDQTIKNTPLPPLANLSEPTFKPPMNTLQIDGGKKQKVRAGDILGALTGKDGIAGSDVGKISIYDNWSFVAIKQGQTKAAMRKLSQGKMKGKNFRLRQLKS